MTSTIHPSDYPIAPRRPSRLHIDPAVLAVALFLATLAVATALLVHFAPIAPADALYFAT
jgi:hypothetical protein